MKSLHDGREPVVVEHPVAADERIRKRRAAVTATRTGHRRHDRPGMAAMKKTLEA
jgi:hypothetical protein